MLRRETGFMQLQSLSEDADDLRLVGKHKSLEAEKLSSSFLFSVMQRGLLRGPKTVMV